MLDKPWAFRAGPSPRQVTSHLLSSRQYKQLTQGDVLSLTQRII
ncbi:hypothetical protein Sez_0488 [Streptococcus equi subsp. zooepidemicus MGCS10565]|uniref:Uncharacterized protein n=1 Tax=Streptococcus equi subsp. zooepidemicus (strain MGCS10565) TaxID=552526 RepID=B4U1J3_STREM|nr:hypothetical protein Sez_0488 [Streptococcus equi subsp. zooepidemicus MGCS10565]